MSVPIFVILLKQIQRLAHGVTNKLADAIPPLVTHCSSQEGFIFAFSISETNGRACLVFLVACNLFGKHLHFPLAGSKHLQEVDGTKLN